MVNACLVDMKPVITELRRSYDALKDGQDQQFDDEHLTVLRNRVLDVTLQFDEGVRNSKRALPKAVKPKAKAKNQS